ncbi:MAG TPA: ATP-dependent zinc metalloprotease FtsH [Acholeplasmataceae bacterium]|nr:ATP-dependent zinc metalloprotease FtsH [Acholeplasmataceae bacterium]HQC30625.1 ATP-dependent zinc metalloprotease FtsH [Acholeplasmataceae bacterium]
MQKQDKPQTPQRKPDFLVIILMILLFIGIFLFIRDALKPKVAEISYFELDALIVDGTNNFEDPSKIAEIQITPVSGYEANGFTITGRFHKDYAYKDFHKGASFIVVGGVSEVLKDRLVDKIGTHNNANTVSEIKFSGIIPYSGVTFWTVLLNLLPWIAIGLMLFLVWRNAASQNNKAFDFAKSRARVARKRTVSFDDVAGADEEKVELAEVVDFLKNPKKYQEIGARIPKGVLLVGPPGTGKTLIAKAVAGEASVPFFTISGSDFVEMFVGVGASRVRDLFKVATQNAPCIIFIDEIDAVGRQRGAGLGGGHDEREQTLNQLLVEMDGFNPNLGIIVIAATNRPDVLDPALLRPGRFDRQITMHLPDVRARAQILAVHARNKKLEPNVNLKSVAHRTPGFSGADLENLLNEAALLAARNNRKVISLKDIDEGIDRVLMGPAKTSRKYNEQERRIVAYHEAGHAVIGLLVEHANVVQKVTIIPRGRAGGYNLMVPKEETFLNTKDQLLATITSFLGGRVAEEIVFDTVTNGAYNDFQNATRIARAMVTEYGMSDLGPIQYEQQSGSVFLGRDYLKEKNFSDKVAHEIDQEVRKIIESCHKQATEVISENRDLLDNIAKYLLLVETLNYNDIQEIKETGGLKHYDDEQKALELSAQEPANVEESVETKVEDAKNEETTEDKKD